MNTADLLRRLENLIRLGTVQSVEGTRCRVEIDDELITNWLPWFTLRAGAVKEWNPPTPGEQVVVFSPSGELTNGIVLAGLFSDENPAPDSDPDNHTRTYSDGAVIRYNRQTHTLDATLPTGGTLNLTCPGGLNITSAGGVRINADVEITGQLTVSDDVIIALIPFLQHQHGGVLPGGALTATPVGGGA